MDTKITEDKEDQTEMRTTDDFDALKSRVKGLSQELAETKEKLSAAQTELKKSERIAAELRTKVDTLSEELDDLRKTRRKSVAEVACQADMVAQAVSSTGGARAGSAGPSDWVTEVGTSTQSISQSVADSVRAVAEAAATRTGFVLDQTSGMYYDCNSGYYYDQVNKLYYDPNNGIYYYYDEGTGSYRFHSQVEVLPSGQMHRGKEKGRAWGKRKERNVDERESSLTSALSRLTLDPMQEPNRSDYNWESTTSYHTPDKPNVRTTPRVRIDLPTRSVSRVLKVDYPPCIRMIVTKSDTLKPGSLFIITCEGGTIGREGSSHVIVIQSVKVSKRHAHIVYDAEERRYTIVDLGSQNGTLLNGKAISEQRVVSEPHPLSHRDYITIGGTTLRLHIHPGDETCDECEPGQVQALIAMQQLNQLATGAASGSKHDKEQQRRKELRHLKKKFNLAREDYANQQDPSLVNPAYADRAGDRRRMVGSDNPYQPDDQPASVDRAIESTNLGHKLLSKMGWAEGQSLGKGDRGIKEPIQAVVHTRNAGLGAGTVQTMDQVQYVRRRNDKWDKARGRLNLMDPQQLGAANRGKKALTWVRGETEKLDASRQQGMVQLPLAGREKGEGRVGTSRGITDIWDESMDTSTSSQLSKSGPSEGPAKGMGDAAESRDPAGKDTWDKRHDTPAEYKRLLLGEADDDKSSEGVSRLVDTLPAADSNSKDVQSGKGRTTQLEQGITKTSPHNLTPAPNVDGGNDSGQIAQVDSSSIDNSNMESLTKPLPDANSPLTTTADSTEPTSAVAPEHPVPPEINSDREQHIGGFENLKRPEENSSPLLQTPWENQEAAANNETENGRSPLLEGVDPTADPTESSSDKGKKIQLKWNKGGKEKLATNLVAFEESESEGEGEEGAAKDGESVEQEQAKAHQGKGDRGSKKRRGASRPSRWSSSRNSVGK